MRPNIAECKLQDGQARNVVTVAQRHNIRSYVSQILGEKREPAQFLPDLIEQFVSRPIHPVTVNRRGLARRDLPELSKAAEMVEPDKVAGLRRPAQSLHPPAISVGANRLPAVQWVAPSLAGRAEI